MVSYLWRRPVGSPVWIFLGSGGLPAKTSGFEGWKSLDFLGFSRPNRAFSKSYAGFSPKKIPRALCPRGRPREGRGHDFGLWKGTDLSQASLTRFLILCNQLLPEPFQQKATRFRPSSTRVGSLARARSGQGWTRGDRRCAPTRSEPCADWTRSSGATPLIIPLLRPVSRSDRPCGEAVTYPPTELAQKRYVSNSGLRRLKRGI